MSEETSWVRTAVGGACMLLGLRVGRDLLAPVLEGDVGVVDQELDAGAAWAADQVQEAYR